MHMRRWTLTVFVCTILVVRAIGNGTIQRQLDASVSSTARRRLLQKLHLLGLGSNPPIMDAVSREALVSLYNQTDGPWWTPYGLNEAGGLSSVLLEGIGQVRWDPGNESSNACTWAGVWCCWPLSPPLTTGYYFVFSFRDDLTGALLSEPIIEAYSCSQIGAVQALTLAWFGLQGQLPTQPLSQLVALQRLQLSHNPALAGGGRWVMEQTHRLDMLSVGNTSLTCWEEEGSEEGGGLAPAAPAINNLQAQLPVPAWCGVPDGFSRSLLGTQLLGVADGGTNTTMTCTTLLVQQAGSTVTLGTTVAISFIHADPALFLWQTCVCERGDVPFVTRTATSGQFVPGCRAAASGARSKGLSVGGAVGAAVGSMVAAAVMLAGAAALLRRRGLLGNDANVKAAAIAPGSRPDLYGPEVTLVATDIAGSTELWEHHPELMNHCLAMHDTLMRTTMATLGGYEVTTEGDAFLVAWHTPNDAVRWCMMVQLALLKLDWPPDLLDHSLCMPRPLLSAASPSASSHLLLFKGLSVRCGVATGVPSAIREHPVTKRMSYTGMCLRLAAACCDTGHGGQCLVEPLTFRGIHATLERLGVTAGEVEGAAGAVNTLFKGATPVFGPPISRNARGSTDPRTRASQPTSASTHGVVSSGIAPPSQYLPLLQVEPTGGPPGVYSEKLPIDQDQDQTHPQPHLASSQGTTRNTVPQEFMSILGSLHPRPTLVMCNGGQTQASRSVPPIRARSQESGSAHISLMGLYRKASFADLGDVPVLSPAGEAGSRVARRRGSYTLPRTPWSPVGGSSHTRPGQMAISRTLSGLFSRPSVPRQSPSSTTTATARLLRGEEVDEEEEEEEGSDEGVWEVGVSHTPSSTAALSQGQVTTTSVWPPSSPVAAFTSRASVSRFEPEPAVLSEQSAQTQAEGRSEVNCITQSTRFGGYAGGGAMGLTQEMNNASRDSTADAALHPVPWLHLSREQSSVSVHCLTTSGPTSRASGCTQGAMVTVSSLTGFKTFFHNPATSSPDIVSLNHLVYNPATSSHPISPEIMSTLKTSKDTSHALLRTSSLPTLNTLHASGPTLTCPLPRSDPSTTHTPAHTLRQTLLGLPAAAGPPAPRLRDAYSPCLPVPQSVEAGPSRCTSSFSLARAQPPSSGQHGQLNITDVFLQWKAAGSLAVDPGAVGAAVSREGSWATWQQRAGPGFESLDGPQLRLPPHQPPWAQSEAQSGVQQSQRPSSLGCEGGAKKDPMIRFLSLVKAGSAGTASGLMAAAGTRDANDGTQHAASVDAGIPWAGILAANTAALPGNEAALQGKESTSQQLPFRLLAQHHQQQRMIGPSDNGYGLGLHPSACADQSQQEQQGGVRTVSSQIDLHLTQAEGAESESRGRGASPDLQPACADITLHDRPTISSRQVPSVDRFSASTACPPASSHSQAPPQGGHGSYSTHRDGPLGPASAAGGAGVSVGSSPAPPLDPALASSEPFTLQSAGVAGGRVSGVRPEERSVAQLLVDLRVWSWAEEAPTRPQRLQKLAPATAHRRPPTVPDQRTQGSVAGMEVALQPARGPFMGAHPWRAVMSATPEIEVVVGPAVCGVEEEKVAGGAPPALSAAMDPPMHTCRGAPPFPPPGVSACDPQGPSSRAVGQAAAVHTTSTNTHRGGSGMALNVKVARPVSGKGQRRKPQHGVSILGALYHLRSLAFSKLESKPKSRPKLSIKALRRAPAGSNASLPDKEYAAYARKLLDCQDLPSRYPANAPGPGSGPHPGPSSFLSATKGWDPVVVVDMGCHRLKASGLATQIHSVYGGVQVIQVLPASLACRATMFPPLVSAAQLSPGYLDAPGATAALTPRLPGTLTPALPPVTLLFISPLQLSMVVEHAGQAVGDRAVAVFCDVARAVMSAYGVYECQEFEGAMMAVAHTPRAAAEAALHLNLCLLACEWPEEVLGVEAGMEEVHPQTGALLFRGLRAKVGIYQGVPLSVVPHANTGRADVFGTVVNRAARLMAGAEGGQVLMDAASAATVLAEWRALAEEREAAHAAAAAAAYAASSAHQGPDAPPTHSALSTFNTGHMDALLCPSNTLLRHARGSAGAPEDAAAGVPKQYAALAMAHGTVLHSGVGCSVAPGNSLLGTWHLTTTSDKSKEGPTHSHPLSRHPILTRSQPQLTITTHNSLLVEGDEENDADVTKPSADSFNVTPYVRSEAQGLLNLGKALRTGSRLDGREGIRYGGVEGSRHGPSPLVFTSKAGLHSLLDSYTSNSLHQLVLQAPASLHATEDRPLGGGDPVAGTEGGVGSEVVGGGGCDTRLVGSKGALPALDALGCVVSLVEEEVQVVDLGEYTMKGVARTQAVAGLQLARLAGRSFEGQFGGKKSTRVREGKGMVGTVQVRLLPLA